LGRNVLSYFVYVQEDSQSTSRVNWFRRPFGFQGLEKGQNGGVLQLLQRIPTLFPIKMQKPVLGGGLGGFREVSGRFSRENAG